MWKKLSSMTIQELFTAYPYATDFFEALPLPANNFDQVRDYFFSIDEETSQDLGIDRQNLIEQFVAFMTQMQQLQVTEEAVKSVTIVGGQDKDGQSEFGEELFAGRY
ncbi:MAG: transporter related protein [Firmicutes bacterium]|nr:transporter related protein [Bacillota bacterium]